MTVVWHVDRLNISHKDSWEVIKLGDWLSSIYDNIKVNQRKVHEYLGMTLDSSTPRTILVSMISYITKIIDEITEVMM